MRIELANIDDYARKRAERRPRTEADKLFYEQKRIRAKALCNHHRYDVITLADRDSDITVNVHACHFCGHHMTPAEIENADRIKHILTHKR